MSENLPHRAPSTVPMQAVEWKGELPDRLRAAFAVELRFKSYLGQNFIEIDAVPEVPALISYLKSNEHFDLLADLTAVDHPNDEKRFEVIYILYSFAVNEYVRIKTRVQQNPAGPHNFQVPSVASLFLAANWLEREVFDMFGIDFPGHPNLKRILMPDDWEGFPLRKDKSIVAMDEDWVHRNLGIESGQS